MLPKESNHKTTDFHLKSTVGARDLQSLNYQIMRHLYGKYGFAASSKFQIGKLGKGITRTLFMKGEERAVGFAHLAKSVWDTNHFGFDVAKLNVLVFKSDISVETRSILIGSIIEEAFKWGTKLLIGRIELQNYPSIISFERLGFNLQDILLTLHTIASKHDNSARIPEGIVVGLASQSDAQQLSELALRISWSNHFHTDPRISRTVADSIIATWIGNILKSENSVILVGKDGSKIIGFVTGRTQNIMERYILPK